MCWVILESYMMKWHKLLSLGWRARRYLIRDAVLFQLLNFRNTLGRILGLDAWLTPNPEALIIQRVQQILLNASAQNRTLYLTQPFTPFALPQLNFTTQQLPALPGTNCEWQLNWFINGCLGGSDERCIRKVDGLMVVRWMDVWGLMDNPKDSPITTI